MFQAKDKTSFGEDRALEYPPGSHPSILSLVPPITLNTKFWSAGEHWEYNNMGVQTLEAVLRNATGQDVLAFAQDHLFSR